MDYEVKLSEIIQLLLSAHQNKKTTTQLHNDLFARINTLVYISQDPHFAKLPDTCKTLLNGALDEFQKILQELSTEEEGIVVFAKRFFSNSSVKKLEAMIPKILKLSDQIIQNLTVKKYIDHQVNQKRRLETLEPDDDVEIIEVTAVAKKKTKGQEGSIKLQIQTNTSFHLKFFCHQKLQTKLPDNSTLQKSEWSAEKGEDTFLIRREDFLYLPKDYVVKISKEHALVRGWEEELKSEELGKEEENKKVAHYEIVNMSMNGTYYLGNKGDGMSRQKPMKLKEQEPFQLRHRDCIGILMDKASKNNDTLLGFEFLIDAEANEEEKDGS